jgi:hypothetical protein
VPVFRRGWRTGGFRLGADKFGQGVAQIPGESFHLGAGFRLLPILECGIALATSFCIFFSSLSDSASRS